MIKAELQIMINLLFLAIITGSVFSSDYKNSKERPFPMTTALKNTRDLISVDNKEMNEMKVELIGGY